MTPLCTRILSGPSFRASASYCKHMKTTYILTIKLSSCEHNRIPYVPFPLKCTRNSDVMKKRDSRNLKVTFLTSLEDIQLRNDPNV